MFIKHLQKVLTSTLFRKIVYLVQLVWCSNFDTNKWQYSGYGIVLDLKGKFTHLDGGSGKNVIIFGADLSTPRHVTNKTQFVLILGHDLTQEINDTTVTAEKIYSPNFTVDNKIFCLSLHYNGENSYLFVNGK